MTLQRMVGVVAIIAATFVNGDRAAAGPADWLVRAGSTVREQFDTSRPRIVRRSIELENASLETLKSRLSWLGIEIPIELSGDVTTSLTAEVDVAALGDAESYRITGVLSSNRLIVEGLALRNLSATVRYVDGQLTLEQLVVAVPDPRPNALVGRARGEATMQLIPVGALAATLELEGVPLEPFNRRIEALSVLTGGRLNGEFNASVPVSNVSDVKAWRGTASLGVSDLLASQRRVSRLSTQAEVAEGLLELTALTATIEGEQMAGSGTLALTTPFDYQASFQVPQGNLSRLSALLRQNLPGAWNGPYRAQADAAGTLRPFAIGATGGVTGTNWTLAGNNAESFEASVESDGQRVTLTKLAARALGGEWTGEGKVALATPYEYQASLNLAGLELSNLGNLPPQLNLGLPVEGVATADFSTDGTLEPQKISARGQASVAGLRLGGEAFETARFEGAFTPEAIELKAFELATSEGRVGGEGRFELDEDRRFSFRFQPQRFDLARLDPVVSAVAMRNEPGVRQTVAYRSFQEDSNATGEDANRNPTTPLEEDAAPEQLGGIATGEIQGEGQGLPFKLDALEGALRFDDLTIAGVTFDRAEIDAETEERTLVLSRLLLVRGEGRLSGDARIGLDPPGAFTANLLSEAFSIDEARPLFGTEGLAEIELPPISGSLDGEVSVVGESQPFRLDSLEGTLAGDDIRIGALLVDEFRIAAATEEESIRISDLLIAIGESRLTGDATVGLEGEQPFEATLRPEQFQIEVLRPLFGEEGLIEADFPPVTGRVTGQMTVRGRVAPGEIEGVSGRLSTENGSYSGVEFSTARIVIATEGEAARVEEMVIESRYGRLAGNGSVGLAAPYRYTAELTFEEFDLATIGELTAALTEVQRPDIESPAEVAPGPGVLPVELEGLANVSGAIEGTFTPFVLTGDGSVATDELLLIAEEVSEVFQPTTLTSPRFDWEYNEDRLTLANINAGLGGGTLSGTAAVPLGDAATGALDLSISAVELGELLRLPGELGGVASGRIAAQLGAVNESGNRTASGTASLSIPALRAGRIAAGDVAADLEFDSDAVAYDVRGQLFDGPLTAEGTLPLDEAATDKANGSFRWEGGNLARVAVVASDQLAIQGRIDAVLNYDLSAATKAAGTVELTGVRQGRMLITDRFVARVGMTDSLLRIENAGGGYAGGTLTLTADFDSLDYTSGSILIYLRRADAARAVGWIPGLEPLTGTLDLRLRGRLGSLWRWEGQAEVGRGSYGPIGFTTLRAPLQIDANPFRGAIRVDSRRGSLLTAHGRGVLNISADLGVFRRIKVDSSFDNLDVERLLDGGSGVASRLSGGRVSGQLSLSSRNYRTLADLEGSLLATFAGSQAQNLPVIGSVVDVARLPTGGGGTVDRGELRVFIRNGVARVEQLALAGPSFRLIAQGTVALISQRLALDVVADTSPARADRLLAAFLLRQFIDYATPVGWIARANRFIAERAIYLRVTGTVSRPVVRVRPVEQLGQEALRFLLVEIAGPVGGTAVTPTP